jgi:hypothetical protein
LVSGFRFYFVGNGWRGFEAGLGAGLAAFYCDQTCGILKIVFVFYSFCLLAKALSHLFLV